MEYETYNVVESWYGVYNWHDCQFNCKDLPACVGFHYYVRARTLVQLSIIKTLSILPQM